MATLHCKANLKAAKGEAQDKLAEVILLIATISSAENPDWENVEKLNGITQGLKNILGEEN